MSRAVIRTIRITRKCFRSRTIRFFIAVCALTSCCTVLAYASILVNENNYYLSEVATTLPTDSVTTPQTFVNIPIVFFITPTYERETQTIHLVQLCKTLSIVQKLIWIVIDGPNQSPSSVKKVLKDCHVHNVHLKTTKNNGGPIEKWNTGLKWLRENIDDTAMGVVYLSYDDSTYNVKLFEEMRSTRVVSVWPVGFIGESEYESPKCVNGRVVGWTNTGEDRVFPLSMGGFAINAFLILTKPYYYISRTSEPSMIANDFLLDIGITVDSLEPLANNCTTINVWNAYRTMDNP